MNYHKKNYNLNDLPNWITFIRDDLKLSGVGMSFARLPNGKGYTFIHRHKYQEEIYVVLDGRGIIYLDGKLLKLSKGDVIRVNPSVYRALKADENCELVCLIVGGLKAIDYPKHPKNSSLIDDGIPDWDKIPPWYEGNKKIIELNKKIRDQRKKINNNL